jgi:hypothetical protein
MKKLGVAGVFLVLTWATASAASGRDKRMDSPSTEDDLPTTPNAVWSIASMPDSLTPDIANPISAEDLAKRHEALVRDAMQKTFDSIADPSGAKTFKEMFSEQPDPDGLLLQADALGYRRGVKFAQRCISRANALISQQKQIAAEVGYLDKNIMYQAGAALVRCKHNLADWSKMIKK